jgi:hypothetical protein
MAGFSKEAIGRRMAQQKGVPPQFGKKKKGAPPPQFGKKPNPFAKGMMG